MADPTVERELWDPAVQGRDPAEAAKLAEEGIREAWRRIWESPIPYYMAKYEAACFGPDALPPLDEIPRTTKPELRADEDREPPLGTYRAVALDQAVRIGSSTGTTGRPTLFFYTRNDLEVHVEVARRNLWRHGLRAGDRFTHSWPQGLYPTGVSAGRQFLDLGVLEIPVGPPFSRETAAEHVRLWQLLRPTGFMVTGSQLQTYLEVAIEESIDLPALLRDSVLAFLEAACQFDRPRRRIEDGYGVRLRNIGGASEIPGFATSDCKFHSGLHVAGDHFVVQVCEPATGREVTPGERGTLVVTGFGIDAVFIRYDLEDIVTQDPSPCPCGESGPRYTLLGRGADMATVQGRGILPIDVQLALDEEEGGAPEFQMSRDGDGRALRLTMETEAGGARIAGLLTEKLGVPVELKEVAPGTLPRASFKPRRTF